jgi:outer membrane protein assembly factor BamB
MNRQRLVLCAVLALAAPLALAADWPQYQGPGRDSISAETGLNKDWNARPPQLLWRIPLGDNGFAGPSVVGGKLFIVDHAGDQDIVRALKLETGEEIWRTGYTDTSRDNYGFSRCTPTYSDGRLYTISRMGWVVCLNAETGEKLWAKNLVSDFNGKRPQWDYSMSAPVDGDRLILSPGGAGGTLLVLNKLTGEKLFSGGSDDVAGYSTPTWAVLDGKKQYIVFTGVSLVGHDGETGNMLWRYPWKTEWDVNAATPIVMGDTVFIASGYKHGCALLRFTADSVSEIWSNKEIQPHFNTPVLVDGLLYGITDPGDMVCLDPKTGATLWRQKGFEKGGCIYVDGTIIGMNGKGGDVVMVQATPEAYKELGRINPLGGQSWTAPIVADGKLIVRNRKEIACLDLK